MNNIDNILNRYFEGTATPEEERVLKKYFQSENVQPQHQIYKPIFAVFDEERQMTAPAFTIPAEKTSKKQALSRNLWMAAAGVAAVMLLVLTLFPFGYKSSSDYLVYINGKQITNPKKAQEHADKMFRQAEEIIRESYKPFAEVNAIQTEMDADKIFNELSQEINNIESINQ